MKKEKPKLKTKNFLIFPCRFSFLNFSFYLLSIGVITAVFFIFLILSTSSTAYAQADQSIWSKGIVQCGGKGQPLCNVCDVFKLVNNLMRLLWSGAALVGTVAFMYGGFLYWRGKPAEAKKVLTNVVIGIAIAFLAWIGIDTIIKLLITQKFSGPAVELPKSVEGGVVKYGPWNQINCQVAAKTSQGGESGLAQPGKNIEDFVPLPPGVSGERIDVDEGPKRARLAQAGVLVNNIDPCPIGLDYRLYQKNTGKSCTSVGGLPDKTIEDLIRLRKECNCSVVVSGGNEAGHKSHGTEKPIVDLRFDQKLADFTTSMIVVRSFGIQKICTTFEDRFYRLHCAENEEVRHLHVEFSR